MDLEHVYVLLHKIITVVHNFTYQILNSVPNELFDGLCGKW